MYRTLFSLFAIIATITAFTPTTSRTSLTHQRSTATTSQQHTSPIVLSVLGGEPERKALTRDSEPDEFFSTNTDKMSDEEKLPIAIAGLVFISLPFVAGLIALYAAK
eukprot:g8341.t1 g8341   contig29:297136-297456(+)